MTTEELKARVAAIPYWYHKIELPGGVVTPGWAPINADQYGLPASLAGMRVLDVGGWDGYWTFEALNRGAKEVVCIDDFTDTLGSLEPGQRRGWETFDLCREALGYGEDVCKRIEMSLYDVSEDRLGRFDVVLFFGTIYHCKYPMFALDKLSTICDRRIYVESAVCDPYSVYRGGMSKGYPEGVVAEFYPNDQYGGNAGNWWVPNLACLSAMLSAAGFVNIQAWPLSEHVENLSECRGFACGSKDPADTDIRGPGVADVVVTVQQTKTLSVMAAMSTPRLGFTDTFFCIMESLLPLRIPIRKNTGVFWGQCLERCMEDWVDLGADAILTIDYDSIFSPADVTELVRIMEANPGIDAVVPLQQGRGLRFPLVTLKGRSGRQLETCTSQVFAGETTKIATGHFGLTLIRVSALLDLPHPWFWEQPDLNGRWGMTRTDADISFWRKMEKHGKKACQANRVVIGHCAGDVILWPSKEFTPIYQSVDDWQKTGKPANVWV